MKTPAQEHTNPNALPLLRIHGAPDQTEAAIEAKLRRGIYSSALILAPGRIVEVHFDGCYFRAGMLRAKTLKGLQALHLKVVK
jgi:hypothetical protein